jgi:hypothetical protein
MKKFIMLSAVMAAVSTAFVACSSDDDLAQAPAAPEETVSEGIPFSVVAFNTDDTRAVRYDANGDGWEPTTGTTPVAATGNSAFVKSFKLYGKQAGASDVWINNLIFARTAKSGDGSKFVPSRLSNNDAYTSTLTWPTDDTKATTFYAITDNDIPTTGDNTNLTGVNWTPASGTFTYTVPKTTTTVGIVEYSNFLDVITANKTNVVDADALRDLMVATAEKNAATAPTNSVSLTFDHIMSGLAINAWLVSNNSSVPTDVYVKAVMVCGLKGYSTYSFASGFAEPTTTDVIYYKQFVSDADLNEVDKGIHLTREPMTKWSDPTLTSLVAPGEWLVIPQNCTPWNRMRDDSDDFPSMSTAFVSILIDDGNQFRLMSFPLTTNAAHKADTANDPLSDLPTTLAFNPGKTRTINLNIALGREHYLGTGTGPAPFSWTPSEVTGD